MKLNNRCAIQTHTYIHRGAIIKSHALTLNRRTILIHTHINGGTQPVSQSSSQPDSQPVRGSVQRLARRKHTHTHTYAGKRKYYLLLFIRARCRCIATKSFTHFTFRQFFSSSSASSSSSSLFLRSHLFLFLFFHISYRSSFLAVVAASATLTATAATAALTAPTTCVPLPNRFYPHDLNFIPQNEGCQDDREERCKFVERRDVTFVNILF